MLHEHLVAAAKWSWPRIPGKRRWWQSPTILRHINRLVCGQPLNGAWAGLSHRMRQERPEGWERAVSVGCGDGTKEIMLLKQGIVRHFDLFEICPNRAKAGYELAEKHGVAERVTFHLEDGLRSSGQYDLVYWNNALHHMLDTDEAVAWSRDRLSGGGHFVMDDFVGANRHQWTDEELDIAQRARELLPERYLRHPANPEEIMPARPAVFPRDKLIQKDPTEAADSENIVPAVRRHFPDAEIIFTGGVIYHLALSDVIANFTEEDDVALLDALLLADEAHATAGQSHYAVAIAKQG